MFTKWIQNKIRSVRKRTGKMETDAVAYEGASSAGAGVDEEEEGIQFTHDPRENLKMKPKRSILKSKSMDKEHQEMLEAIARNERGEGTQGARFDEMNILATHHPEGKEYGHMKIEEPKTPFNYYSDSGEECDTDAPTDRVRRVSLTENPLKRGPINANELTERLESTEDDGAPKIVIPPIDDDSTPITEEERVKRRQFEQKRKAHYNEGKSLKMARKLLEQDAEEIEKLEEQDRHKSESPPPMDSA